MKNFALFLAALFNVSLALSQTISGSVKNSRKEAVAGATVRLYPVSDSSSPLISVTGADGAFHFRDVSKGKLTLTVELIGHSPVHMTIVADSASVSLPEIILSPASSKELAGVVVKSKKPLLEHSIDKTTVNVDAMITSAASNVLEVLSHTPGVTVDNNGSISLNGKNGVLVLIDGRQTYMSPSDLAAYLASMPGATLDKIELIDNPSARYDAAGNAIINLQLKKARTAGWTGNLSAGYTKGRYGRQSYSGNLNYHSKDLNVFVNLGHNADKIYSNDIIRRNYYTAGGEQSSAVDLENNQFYRGRSVLGTAGADYQLSKRTAIGFLLNLSRGKRNGVFDYNSITSTPDGHGDGRGYGATYTVDKFINKGANLNLLHKFARKGSELSADINMMRYRTDIEQDLENFLQDDGGSETLASRFSYVSPSSIRIYTAKSDYTQLLGKGKLEAGIKTSFVKNDRSTDQYDKAGSTPVWNQAMSNHFIYDENVNAAYVNTQQRWARFALQAGLRTEQTNIRGHQVGNAVVPDMLFRRNYINWFPSAAISYKLDSTGTKQLSFLYSKRINRPNYQSLNPFLFFRDNLSYSGGNPMLNPQMQIRYELKYQQGQLWWAGLSYNDFRSVILPVTVTQDSLFITRQQNYGRGYMVLLNVGINVSPVKAWTINSTMRFSRMGLRGTFDGLKIGPNTNVFRWEFNNYFVISKKLSAELNSYYASADLNGQNSTRSMYRVNGGVQYKFSDKVSIRLIMDDVFHSWKYHYFSNGLKQADYTQVNTSDTQRFGLAFSYRFGKKAAKAKKSMDEEEMGRAQ